jgi:hypothetical protein
MNFRVHIFRTKAQPTTLFQRVPLRVGLLTVPLEVIGEGLLSIYGDGGNETMKIQGHEIKIRKSNKEIRRDVLNIVRTTKWVDPRQRARGAGAKEWEKKGPELQDGDDDIATMEEKIPVDLVQFGYERRDRIFSIEWDSPKGSNYLKLDPDNRRVEIFLPTLKTREMKAERAKKKIREADETITPDKFTSTGLGEEGRAGLTSFFQGLATFSLDLSARNEPEIYEVIQFRYSQIKWIAVQDLSEKPSAMIQLEYPPTFLKRTLPPSTFLAMFAPDKEMASDTQLSHFENDAVHETVAPYASDALVLIFPSQKELYAFKKLCRARIRKSCSLDIPPIERFRLFSAQRLVAMQSWFASLPSNVAYRLDGFLRGGLVDTHELEILRSSIDYLVLDKERREEMEDVPVIMTNFANALKTWGKVALDGDDDAEGDGGGEDKGGGERASCILAILGRAVRTFNMTPRKKMRPRSKGVIDCWHAKVTPTAIRIEGEVQFMQQVWSLNSL